MGGWADGRDGCFALSRVILVSFFMDALPVPRAGDAVVLGGSGAVGVWRLSVVVVGGGGGVVVVVAAAALAAALVLMLVPVLVFMAFESTTLSTSPHPTLPCRNPAPRLVFSRRSPLGISS